MPAPVAIRPLLFKPHRLNGLSEQLLVSHYENNYGGALRRLNAIISRLGTVDWQTAPVFEVNGLKREELIASGSVTLHEIYFDGLGGAGGDPEPNSDIAAAIERDFGGMARWRTEFTAMAKAQGGGSGWTLLVWSPRLGRLVNQWAADHSNTLAAGVPVLAIDVYEHSFHIDFGARAAAYVDAIMGNLDWSRINARYRSARGQAVAPEVFIPAGAPAAIEARIGGEELLPLLERDSPAKPYLLDVCLEIDLPKRTDTLPGAVFRAPEALDQWADELPRDRPLDHMSA